MLGKKQTPFEENLGATNDLIAQLVRLERAHAFWTSGGEPTRPNDVVSRAYRREEDEARLIDLLLSSLTGNGNGYARLVQRKVELEALRDSRAKERQDAHARLGAAEEALSKERLSDGYLRGADESRQEVARLAAEAEAYRTRARDAAAAIEGIGQRLSALAGELDQARRERLPAEAETLSKRALELANLLAVVDQVRRRAWSEYCVLTAAVEYRNAELASLGGREVPCPEGYGAAMPTPEAVADFRRNPTVRARDTTPAATLPAVLDAERQEGGRPDRVRPNFSTVPVGAEVSY
jgi:hypothetical protein